MISTVISTVQSTVIKIDHLGSLLKLWPPLFLEITSVSDSEIALSWDIFETKHEGHKIYKSTDGINYTEIGSVLGIAPTYTATGLTSGTLYYFKVIAYKGSVNSISSNVVSDTPLTYLNKIKSVEPANLLVYYPMNEAAGTAVVDGSGNSRNGLYRSGVALNQTGIGDGIGAPVFDGVDDNINIDSPSLVSAFNGDEGTVHIWVKLDASILTDGLVHTILSFVGVTAGNNIAISKVAINNTISVFRDGGTVQNTYSMTIADSNYHCITLSWSLVRDEYWVYLDGVNQKAPNTRMLAFSGILNHDRMTLAQTYAFTQRFKGQLAHLAIWSKPLSAGDIYKLSSINRVNNTIHPNFTRLSVKSLYREVAPNDWLGRPSLADKNGLWIMMYRQSGDHNSADVNCTHHIRFSEDYGVTWSDADKLIGGASVTGAPFTKQAGNTNQPGGQVIIAPNGDILIHIYETGTATGTYQWRSIDNGATFTLDGRINNDQYFVGEEDHTIIGSDIYVVVRNTTVSGSEDTDVYKSSNNGVSWIKQGSIETVLDANETGITATTGNNMLAVARSSDMTHTYLYRSSDLGATWSDRVDVTDMIRVMHKPRLRYINNKIYLMGRDYIGLNLEYTVLYTSSDNGLTWSTKFYPELPGLYSDCGYCDMLKRPDGKIYMLSYAGTISFTDIKEYVFEEK